MIKDKLLDYVETHLEKSGKNYCCPLCGSGTHAKGTGAFSIDQHRGGQYWKCFSCEEGGDIFDLVEKTEHLKTWSDKVKYLKGLYPEEDFSLKEDNKKEAPAEPPKDYTAEIEEAKEHLKETDYLTGRGISLATQEVCGVGYDPSKRAVILPGVSYTEKIKCYTERKIDNSGIRYINKGSSSLFNAGDLKKSEPLFIVEGAIDCMSIIDIGFNAIGLNSKANTRNFINFIKEHSDKIKTTHFFIALDNEDKTVKDSEILKTGLESLGYACSIVTDIAGKYKDCNDALCNERNAFRERVQEVYSTARKSLLKEINKNKVGALLPQFQAYIKESEKHKPISTGFERLDEAIGGGLYPKIYIVGAEPSLGKTTLVLQIADQIADGGNDVLIFSLEMAKEDIMARSISRCTYEIALKEKLDMSLPKTELGVLTGSRYENYSEDEKKLISAAVEKYGEYAGYHISIYEGKHTAAKIMEITEQYIKATGVIPIVVIDYLQIITPDEKMLKTSIREQIDYDIDTLATMKRELKTPIIGISSFNRSSYDELASNASFKESGTIEYTADAIITLELDFEVPENKRSNKYAIRTAKRKAMEENPRVIKAKFHKNRGNKATSDLLYFYNPKFNHFEERPTF